ncbi:SDR family oxidoreductase [Pediococcus parvulus]|jgi:nucleoside-diphosphate-sugar epimerase|uniref:SDR family oxidoreductase n=1 Tax=Pediococcus parvulus TaxID=54062 RepID=UPI00070C3EDD|nr:SDR family oxidoreductase [Pediococcus parvulus]MDN5575830.1 SDR family oxidoreductase [Pediococcus sp.]MCT3027326.1 SDR family oxidoreductase [Pediococcus parvulus]MCT3030940.1 SDR family oxidoreductase [Pediococcus parvulus]GEL89324.1 short-chain dehydrogenase [Pediococcus parvulus]GHC07474.1 short-chain dehydrogenase [Pediococcus parvulus]
MKVFVIGAHGQIGKLLVAQLLDRGDEVVAGIRDAKQRDFFEDQGAATQLFDLTEQPDEMAKVLAGVDAVVFSAGSGGKTGDDQTLLIDLDGAVKSMEATQKAGIKRFVIVSAMNAEDRTRWTAIQPYYVAKHYADLYLKDETSLDYTIIKPGVLTNDAGKGGLILDQTKGKIAREDVAETIVSALHNDNTIKKEFAISEGETPINEAVKQV